MAKQPNNRGHFSSSFGFILASAGSAVGLGNLWKFPYVAGSSGGGLFLLFYIFFILILGVPILLAEMSIGRKTQLNPIGAFKKLNKAWTFVGGLGVISAFIILSYYSVVGGWVIKYLLQFIAGGNFGTDTTSYFNEFISSPVEPIIYHIVFMAITAIIVIGGVSKGIEKVSKIMLPGLLILTVIIAIRSVTLNGAVEGIKFFLLPDFSAFKSINDVGRILVVAMGQVFFSLSIGTGITITYGSYLKKDSNLPQNAMVIAGLDSLVAILSGLAILPAVFALGMQPSAGPGLLFQTLSSVFDTIPFGVIFGIIFFLLVLFAAITSSISMLEVSTSYLIDNFGISRKVATISLASVMTIIGIFASLSFGPLKDLSLLGMNIFDLLGYLTDKILMPLVGLLTCVFVGYIYGVDNLSEEIKQGIPHSQFKLKQAFAFSIKYLAPALILIIFIMGIIPA